MRKIQTLFLRDPADMSRVTSEVNPKCQWVLDGDGVPTQKHDGTAVKIDGAGVVWKRREVKPGKPEPFGFVLEEHDENTGKSFGWMPVGDGPEDRWLREALNPPSMIPGVETLTAKMPGTYELCGPKVQGNPERLDEHVLIRHGSVRLDDFPRTFARLVVELQNLDVEGIVWHHPDGRMAKIKKRDFGLARKPD